MLGVAAAVAASGMRMQAMSPDSAPALPAPSGTLVNVSTVAQLQSAVSSVTSNKTIVIAPGTYHLTSTLYLNGSLANVTIRGATNNRDDVVLVGKGMGVADANVPFGIWTGGNVTGLTIANLTIRDIYQHPIIFNTGTQSPHVYNVHLINAGQQFLKANPDGSGGGVNNGIVEYSVFEYTSTAPNDYTNGVDVHAGQNWIVRHNLFRRIRAPQGQLAGPAILMWNGSSGSIVDGNTFIDCQREISLGLVERTPNDHTGGIVRNNFIYRSSGAGGDVGIGVMDSPNTQVVHNTIFINGQYPNAIEYRFANTTGVTVVNNLGDRGAQARDGAAGSQQSNIWTATASWFVNTAAGDLHLAASATAAINHGAVTSSAPIDWDGQARPAGGASDVGADEYASGGTPPPSDTTPPSVALTAPAAGATVHGTIAVSASAMDNVGVASVQFTLDGVNLGTADVTAPYSATWTTTSVANGSHTLRAVARDAAGNTQTSSLSVTVNNAPPPKQVTGDFNGDGRPDLIFEHASGQIYVWFMNRDVMTGGAYLNPSAIAPAWQIAAVADFNGDGKSDVLFQHTTTGQLIVWLLNGVTKIGELTPLPTPTPWRVRGAGDFNGDGMTDLVWQHPSTGQLCAWLMNNAGGRLSVEYLNPSQADPAWRIAGVADINHDGKADLVWEHRVTGALAVWHLDRLTATSAPALSPAFVNPAWILKVVGDFDGDGDADLVFQHAATGQMYTWYMNGLSMIGGSYLSPAQVNVAWHMAGDR
jgi:hypothetical protein